MMSRVLYLLSIVLMFAIPGCMKPAATVTVPYPDLLDAYVEVTDFLNERRSVVVTNPNSAEAWGNYGMALQAHEYSAIAIDCYRKAVELAPSDARWSYLLALKLRETNAEKAESLLQTAVNQKDAGLAVWLALADLQLDMGQTQAHQTTLSELEQSWPEHPAVKFRRAESLFAAGNLNEADAILTTLDDFAESLRLRNQIAALTGESSVAEQPIDAPRQISDTVSDPFLAQVMRCRRDPLWRGKVAADRARSGDQIALMTLQNLVRQHPELVDNRVQLSLILHAIGRYEQADQLLLEGLKLAKTDTRLLAGRATLAILNEKWSLAESILTDTIANSPNQQSAWADLGFVREQLKQPDLALQAYDQALSLDPGDETVRARRANLTK